jgi:hypothetical protein
VLACPQDDLSPIKSRGVDEALWPSPTQSSPSVLLASTILLISAAIPRIHILPLSSLTNLQALSRVSVLPCHLVTEYASSLPWGLEMASARDLDPNIVILFPGLSERRFFLAGRSINILFINYL